MQLKASGLGTESVDNFLWVQIVQWLITYLLLFPRENKSVIFKRSADITECYLILLYVAYMSRDPKKLFLGSDCRQWSYNEDHVGARLRRQAGQAQYGSRP